MRSVLALSLTAALAACASTETRCIREATRDLRTVDALIEESQATIARGYAYETVPSNVGIGVSYCGYSWGNIGVGACVGNSTWTSREPVAVDLVQERQKLAELERKRAQLASAAAPAIASCGAGG